MASPNGHAPPTGCPLPQAPIPSLEHTLQRYSEYASVLAESHDPAQDDIETMDEVREAIADFLPVGKELQARLECVASNEECWVNRYWLPEMYLKQRYPLVWNSNPAYVFPRQRFSSIDDQLNYAAWMVYAFVEFKERIDKKALHQEISRGGVPMCMDQYRRLFSTYREAHRDVDFHYGKGSYAATSSLPLSSTILVMFHAQCFIAHVQCPKTGKLLPPAAIQAQLTRICEMGANRHPATVLPVGAITAGTRDGAAKFWDLASDVDTNKESLELAKEALFTLCLDTGNEELQWTEREDGSVTRPNPLNTDQLSQREYDGLQLLHGFGSPHYGANRWYDSTIQLVVSQGGCCGLCIEHSVAEGIVIIRMVEAAMETVERGREVDKSPNGSLTAFLPDYRPQPLSWALSEEIISLLRSCASELDRLARDAQLAVISFKGYGKEAIKGWGLSPDGFVQLALQLAHYRLHHYAVSTYESATLRQFTKGRVDNIRAATPEALEWVRAMVETGDERCGREEKLRLLREAAAKQAAVTRENINGEGIDNHLCALEVLARKRGELPRLFTQSMWRELMRFPLSTSQVSVDEKQALEGGTYLCYGPVVEDGYGCAYGIYSSLVVFAISAYKSNKRTDLGRFREELVCAMREMRQICEGTGAV